MYASIDLSFRENLARFAGPRFSLERLGAKGLASWDDVVRLEPCVRLPLMLGDDIGATEQEIGSFVAAHHAGAHFGFIADRVHDGQTDAIDEGLALTEAAARIWEQKLAAAVGSAHDAARGVRAARTLLDVGIRMEQRSFAQHSTSVARYARAALARLWWAGLAADAFLQRRAQDRRESFRMTFALLALSLQLLDDAADSDEDQRLRGCDTATLLHLPVRALARASLEVTDRARETAQAGRLGRLATWLERRAHELQGAAVGAGFQVELAARGVADVVTKVALRSPRYPRLGGDSSRGEGGSSRSEVTEDASCSPALRSAE